MTERQPAGCLCFFRRGKKLSKGGPQDRDTRAEEPGDEQQAREASNVERHVAKVEPAKAGPATAPIATTTPVCDTTASAAAPQPTAIPAVISTAVVASASSAASPTRITRTLPQAPPAPVSSSRVASPLPSPGPGAAETLGGATAGGTVTSPLAKASASGEAGGAHPDISTLSTGSHVSTAYFSAGGWSQFGDDGEWLGGSPAALQAITSMDPAEPGAGVGEPTTGDVVADAGLTSPGPGDGQGACHFNQHREHHHPSLHQQHPHHPHHRLHPEHPPQGPSLSRNHGAPLDPVDESDGPADTSAAAVATAGAAVAATAGVEHGLVPQPSLLPEVVRMSADGPATVLAAVQEGPQYTAPRQPQDEHHQGLPQPNETQAAAAAGASEPPSTSVASRDADGTGAGAGGAAAVASREAALDKVVELYTAEARPCKACQVLLQYCKSASVPPASLAPELQARKLPDAAPLAKVVQGASECLADISTDAGWQLVRSDELQLLYRNLPAQGVHAFRARCTLDYPIEEPLALTREIDLAPTWNKYCTSAFVLKETSITDLVVYMSLWAPWPLNNVGFLVEATGAELYAEEGCLLICIKTPDKAAGNGEALPPLPTIAAKHNKIKLLAPSCITFSPLPPAVPGGPQRVRCTLQAYVDPGLRHVPAFLISFVLKVLSPFIYTAALKVLASAFKSPDNPLPQRIKQHAELYGMVRHLTEAYLKTPAAAAAAAAAASPPSAKHGNRRR